MEFDFLGLAHAVLAVLSFQGDGSKFLNYFPNLIMSVQASLALEYVERVKKIPESRAINPDTLKTLKDLKLKLVNCVSIKIHIFFQGAMMVLKTCHSQNISHLIAVSEQGHT